MKITKLLLVILTLALLLTGMTACKSEEENQDETDPNAGACDMVAVQNEIDSMRISDFEETNEVTDYVKFTVKDYGTFIVRLRKDIAPITVEYFQNLVSNKFYDGLTFHRVKQDFMIQGGDPKGDGTGGSEETIRGEFFENNVRNELSHCTGVISMARLSNNMDSASSQFFICNANAAYSLDGSYAAFGYVVAGLETVLIISVAEVKMNTVTSEISQPKEPIYMEKGCFVNKK